MAHCFVASCCRHLCLICNGHTVTARRLESVRPQRNRHVGFQSKASRNLCASLTYCNNLATSQSICDCWHAFHGKCVAFNMLYSSTTQRADSIHQYLALAPLNVPFRCLATPPSRRAPADDLTIGSDCQAVIMPSRYLPNHDSPALSSALHREEGWEELPTSFTGRTCQQPKMITSKPKQLTVLGEHN